MGNVQTTYADWAKSLVCMYPGDLKFELIKEKQKVIVYSEGVDVASFDFIHSVGELLWDSINHERDYAKDPQFKKFDVNDFIK